MPLDDLIQYDTNVDDMDPRLWPGVIDALLAAGARDAWLTPIVMKKGRPAFTLSALCDTGVAESVRATMFAQTTTIGVRETEVRRHSLDRTDGHIDVDGESVATKTSYAADGSVSTRSVEWDDVATAAERLGLSAEAVLRAAIAAAEHGGSEPGR